MLYVSACGIFTKGADSLVDYYGDPLGHWINATSFFGGLALIGIIDALIPHAENPHEIHTEFETTPIRSLRPTTHCRRFTNESDCQTGNADMFNRKLLRMGLFTVTIAIHNFPEGLITFLAALEDPSLGVAIAIAIALQYSGRNQRFCTHFLPAIEESFFWSFMSGLAEPVAPLSPTPHSDTLSVARTGLSSILWAFFFVASPGNGLYQPR